jgi:hypothetical protein
VYAKGWNGSEKFEIATEEHLRQQIAERWNLEDNQDQLDPVVAMGKEGAGYLRRPIVRGEYGSDDVEDAIY